MFQCFTNHWKPSNPFKEPQQDALCPFSATTLLWAIHVLGINHTHCCSRANVLRFSVEPLVPFLQACELYAWPLDVSVLEYQWLLCIEHQDKINTDLVLFLLVQSGALRQEQKYIGYGFGYLPSCFDCSSGQDSIKNTFPKGRLWHHSLSHAHTHRNKSIPSSCDFFIAFPSRNTLSGQRKDRLEQILFLQRWNTVQTAEMFVVFIFFSIVCQF